MAKVAISIEERMLCIIALKVCYMKRDELELQEKTADAMNTLAESLDPDGALNWALAAVTE